MEAQRPPASQPEHHGVAGDLMARLHAANQRFHETRRKLEEGLASYAMDREARLDELRRELHAAEAELEELDRQIHGRLEEPPR